MNDKSRIIDSGPFEGKKIEFAPTTEVDRFFGISNEFMKNIFNFDPKLKPRPKSQGEKERGLV